MKRIAAIFVIVILVGTGYYFYSHRASVEKVGNSLPAPVFSARTQQWEFLVVSFGKTYFTAPNEVPEMKTDGLSKLLSYSKVGIVSAQEAVGTQNQMDTLGKFGWELVGVVGAIGGDQQMLFKRQFDAGRSEKEAVWIKEEGARLLAAKEQAAKVREEQDKAAREKLATEAAAASHADLIDLDVLDAAAASQARSLATTENRKKEEDRVKAAIGRLSNYTIVVADAVSSATAPDNSDVKATVTVDGTSTLLKDGNKFRLSEARVLAKQVAQQIYKDAGLKQRASYYSPEDNSAKEVRIDVSVSIRYANSSKVVVNERIGGVWPHRVER